jgi:hypothetical protein
LRVDAALQIEEVVDHVVGRVRDDQADHGQGKVRPIRPRRPHRQEPADQAREDRHREHARARDQQPARHGVHLPLAAEVLRLDDLVPVVENVAERGALHRDGAWPTPGSDASAPAPRAAASERGCKARRRPVESLAKPRYNNAVAELPPVLGKFTRTRVVVLVTGRTALARIGGIASVARHVATATRLGFDPLVVYPARMRALGAEIEGELGDHTPCLPSNELADQAGGDEDLVLVIAGDWYVSPQAIVVFNDHTTGPRWRGSRNAGEWSRRSRA